MNRSFTGDPALDAIIVREIRYGQTRWTEVWLACIMVGLGLILLDEDRTFDLPSWRFIAGRVSEETAGAISFGVGLLRLGALWINGSHRWPIVRILGCMGGALFFGALSLGFLLTPGPITTGVAVYGILAVAELHASGRAARDAYAFDSFGTRERRRNRDRLASLG